MTNILVTGSTGFVGRSLLNELFISNKYRVFIVDRKFSTIFPFIPKKIDYTIHLACMHRATNDNLIYNTNIEINTKLIALLSKHNLNSNIVFTSSSQEVENFAYGKSKRDGAIFFNDICEKWDKRFIKIILPNLYGPFAKPFHTSVVANFCRSLIDCKEVYINQVELELLYIQGAINQILTFESRETFETTKIFLPELYKILEKLYKDYISNTKIILNSKFEAQLLTTLMSYTNGR